TATSGGTASTSTRGWTPAAARVPGVFDADLSHLRTIVVAGGPVTPPLIQQDAEPGIYLQQAWGLTETAPFATHLPVERTLDKLGSAGIPMPYTEIRVVDRRLTNQWAPVPAARWWCAARTSSWGTGRTGKPPAPPSTTRAGSTPATSATSTR